MSRQEFDYREIAEILGECGEQSAFTAVRLTFLKSIAKIVRHILAKSQGVDVTEHESLTLANDPRVQEHVSDILHSMTLSLKQRNAGEYRVEET